MKKKTITQEFLRFIKDEKIYQQVMNVYIKKHDINPKTDFIADILEKKREQKIKLIQSANLFCNWSQLVEDNNFWRVKSLKWMLVVFKNSNNHNEKNDMADYLTTVFGENFIFRESKSFIDNDTRKELKERLIKMRLYDENRIVFRVI